MPDAQVAMLTREQVERWRDWLMDTHAGADRVQLSWLCDMALRAEQLEQGLDHWINRHADATAAHNCTAQRAERAESALAELQQAYGAACIKLQSLGVKDVDLMPPELAAARAQTIDECATECDDLASAMESGAGELEPGQRLRQAARNIRALAARTKQRTQGENDGAVS